MLQDGRTAVWVGVVVLLVSEVLGGPQISPPKQHGKRGGDSRVVGGIAAARYQWPWQAALRLKSNGHIFCGGSLLSREWVVTAAHCFRTVPRTQMYVSLGDFENWVSTENALRVAVDVKEVIMHPKYKRIGTDNDIALLRLEEGVEFTEGVQPICLPCGMSEETFQGRTGTVTGWGTTSWQGRQSSVLMEVDLPLLTTRECQQYLGHLVTTNMMCTYKVGKDACQGDSGGPLVWNDQAQNAYYLVGIVSWGDGCAKESAPGVYTKVINYVDWIQQQTSIKSCGDGN